jgi:copper chaperone CopZ
MKFRSILLIASLLFVLKTQATSIQFISIGVNGLTCSMCTRSVEMSILKLDFVDSVAMDLENTDGMVYLKPGAAVDLRKVAKAVTNSGFSVRFMRIQVNFDTPLTDTCFSIGPDSFQFIGSSKKPTGLKAELMMIGDEFMPKKELTKYRKQMVATCPAQNGFYVSSL